MMANGDTGQYNYLKGLEEAEFFNIMDSFKKKQQKQRHNVNRK
jgi:hypothetical protein